VKEWPKIFDRKYQDDLGKRAWWTLNRLITLSLNVAGLGDTLLAFPACRAANKDIESTSAHGRFRPKRRITGPTTAPNHHNGRF
jgi:hypothetical protein